MPGSIIATKNAALCSTDVISTTGWDCCRYGGEGGILPESPKKFSVAMVKLKSFGVNERFGEKRFCQCHWEI